MLPPSPSSTATCDRLLGRTRASPAARRELGGAAARMAWRLLLMPTRRCSRRRRVSVLAAAPRLHLRLSDLDQWNAGWGRDDHRYEHDGGPRLGAPGAVDCHACGCGADVEPRLRRHARRDQEA